MPKTISLKGEFIRKEGIASGVITPGHLIEFGGSNDVQVSDTAGEPCRKAFALENDLVGKGIDDDYASGEVVQYGVFPPGAEVYAWLDDDQTVNKGDPLSSNGNGRLQAAQAFDFSPHKIADYIVAFALEDVSGGGSLPVRIKVEVA